MRRTGSLIELPLKALVGAAGWARERISGEPPPENPSQQFARKLEENLLTATTDLHQQVLSPQLAAAAAAEAGDAGRPAAVNVHPRWCRPGSGCSKKSSAPFCRPSRPAGEIGDIGADMEMELGRLADHFRRRMGVWDKVAQTFWAFLNVLPAAAAVTYVLSTGDPVGGATIKVKLAGLFGLKDLYALVAIPVTRGLKRADQKQLQEMLGPVAQTWLSHKFEGVRGIFEQEITGDILRTAEEAAGEAERRIAAAGECLAREAEGETR